MFQEMNVNNQQSKNYRMFSSQSVEDKDKKIYTDGMTQILLQSWGKLRRTFVRKAAFCQAQSQFQFSWTD